tara:strand:- start:423 stop:980 length:558 start_codon:yes stop_codon:yes gene_type:complete
MKNKHGVKKIAAPYSGSGLKNQFDTGRKASKINNGVMFSLIKLRNYLLHRIAYFFPINNVRVLCHKWRGVKTGKNIFIGLNCVLDHAMPDFIILDDDTRLAGEVYLLAHSRPSEKFKGKIMSYIAPIHIKEGAWLGIRTTVLPGVTIGKYAIVTPGSVVLKDVPDYSVVRGNPAEIIRKLNNNKN